MFSITLKQSVATLGVVAGLLAAAGPASAIDFTEVPISSIRTNSLENTMVSGYNVKAAAAGTQVGSEGEKDDVPLETVSFTIKGAADRGEVTGLEPTVKSPASPTSEVFTSVSNVAPLHGDTEARVGGKMYLEDISLGIIGDTGAVVASPDQTATPQGFIMSDGRICNPRWGC